METLFVLADHANGHHGGWFLFPLLLWTALIIGGTYLFMRSRRRGDGNGTGRAREILAERYASGELSPEEYRQRLGELRA